MEVPDPFQPLPPLRPTLRPEELFPSDTPEPVSPPLSTTAQALCGKRIPPNTARSNNTALRAFATFVATQRQFFKPDYMRILLDNSNRSYRRASLIDQAVRLTKMTVFSDTTGMMYPAGHSQWTKER